MTVDEFKEILNNIPKVQTDKPISSMNAINIDELIKTVERLKKIPTYEELQKENNKLQEEKDELIKLYTEETYLRHQIDLELYIEKSEKQELIEYLKKQKSNLHWEMSELCLGMCDTKFQEGKLTAYEDILKKIEKSDE